MGADHYDFGSKLREARERKKLTLETAAKETRIKQEYIEALERGQFPEQVGEAYAQNFLRNYAKFLGLPADELLPKSSSRSTSKVAKRKQPKIRRDIVTTKLIFFGSLSLMMVGIIGYLIWQILILSSPPPLKIGAPDTDIVVTSPEYVIEGRTSLGSEVHINDVAILLGPDGSFSHRAALRQGVNNFEITSTNRLGKIRVEERAIVFAPPLEEQQ